MKAEKQKARELREVIAKGECHGIHPDITSVPAPAERR